MLEVLFSALITILPDYIYRTRVEGKRLGHEITLFSVWYELRWGITACAVLAISLIAVIFFFHPSAKNVVSLYRTVSILSDVPGRVEEVYAADNQRLEAGDPIFRLDTRRQRAAAETARRRMAEVDAALDMAAAEISVAQGNILSAESALRQAREDLARRQEIQERNPNVVSGQELDTLAAAVEGREGALKSARAQLEMVEARIASVLPAQRAVAEAALNQALTEIEKATVYAGSAGTVKQFKLEPGDIVNPILRPAGILVPETSGVGRFQAAFGQISAPVIRRGMLAEITCAARPLEVIPMVVTNVQGTIASGQLRPTDQLIDLQDRKRPGTILATLEPVFPGQADGIPPGSRCAAVAYSSHAEQIAAGDITGFKAVLMPMVDGMGIANAIVIRGQALLLPVWALVFS